MNHALKLHKEQTFKPSKAKQGSPFICSTASRSDPMDGTGPPGSRGSPKPQGAQLSVLPSPCATAAPSAMERKKEGKGRWAFSPAEIRTSFLHVPSSIQLSESTSTSRPANISIDNLQPLPTEHKKATNKPVSNPAGLELPFRGVSDMSAPSTSANPSFPLVPGGAVPSCYIPTCSALRGAGIRADLSRAGGFHASGGSSWLTLSKPNDEAALNLSSATLITPFNCTARDAEADQVLYDSREGEKVVCFCCVFFSKPGHQSVHISPILTHSYLAYNTLSGKHNRDQGLFYKPAEFSSKETITMGWFKVFYTENISHD